MRTLSWKNFLSGAIALGGVAGIAWGVTDDFNDNAKNTQSWFFSDFTEGNGIMQEINGRIEYTCSAAVTPDSASRTWARTLQNVDTNWSMQLDITNTFNAAAAGLVSMGIYVTNPGTGHEINVKLHQWDATLKNGFSSEFLAPGSVPVVPDATTGDLGVTSGAVRISYNAAAKVVSTWHDADGPTGGYTWTQLATYGIGGSGGVTGNSNWGMAPTAFFGVGIYGYSESTAVASGVAFGDNFTVTGDPDISVIGKNREIVNNDRKPSKKDKTDFGTLKKRKATNKFTVQNRGTDDLIFVSPNARLKGGRKNRKAFKLRGKPATLASRTSQTVRVVFKPRATGRYRTWMMFLTNDPDEPLFRCRLGGKALR